MVVVPSSIGVFGPLSLGFLALGALGTTFWIWMLVEKNRVRATTRWCGW